MRASHSPWVGIQPGTDPLKWAAVLRRAHSFALKRGSAPAVLRRFIASSWEESATRGLDPDGYAPVALDSDATRKALARHPVSHLLRGVERMLREATDDSKYLLALSDSDGVLLSVTGHPDALMVAGGGGFEPGHLCSEEALGTNAVGTALKLSHPVQIFSAEHFSRRLHGLTCSAAPIRDPETNRPIGVLNLSGDFRTCHPHSLTLVASVCRLIEETLAREQKEQDNRLRDLFIDRLGAGGGSRSALVSRSGRVIAAYPRGWLGRRMKVSVNGNLVLPSGIDATLEQIKGSGGSTLVDDVSRSPLPGRSSVMLEALPAQLVRASNGNWQVDLSPRHSEIVSLLALHPDGLSGEELRTLLRQPNLETVTVRAEISRIRRLLGPVILSRPYRLDPSVQADLRSLRQALDTD